MGAAEAKQAILDNRTALGIEFGSTRIKAVLVDGNNAPIASGGHEWENRDVYKRQELHLWDLLPWPFSEQLGRTLEMQKFRHRQSLG